MNPNRGPAASHFHRRNSDQMTTTTIPVRPLATVKLATFGVLALALLLLNGCRWVGVKGNGDVKTEDRPIGEFTKLEADGRVHAVAIAAGIR